MRMLKAIVIGMGVLIVVGSAVIVVKIAQRGGGDDGAANAGPAVTPATIALPAGARVIETALDGDRIALRIALEGGGEQVLIIDARTGRHIGAVHLVPERRDGGATTASP
jgi:hypothetical protein